MSDQKKPYTPDGEQMQAAWIAWQGYGSSEPESAAEFDRFIAKVKRDAAREALDGLADHEAALHSRDPEVYAECLHVVVSAKSWRETHYRIEDTP